MNSLDCIILVVIFIGVSIGYSRGFLISIISFVGYLAALIGLKLYSVKFAEFLKANTSIYKIVNNYVEDRVKHISILNYDNPIFEKLLNQHIIQVGENISDVVSHLIMIAISGIILFFTIKVFVFIIGKMLNSFIKKSYLLNTTNKMLGLMLGGIGAIIIVVVGITVITPFAYTSSSTEFSKLFTESMIINFYYESDLYSKILLNI